MSKSEEQFLKMFGDSLRDFSPEVPNSVYEGIRGQMRKKSFFAFSLTSLNIWYVLLAGSLVATAVYTTNSENLTTAQLTKSTDIIDEGIYRPDQHLSAIASTEVEDENQDIDQLIAESTISLAAAKNRSYYKANTKVNRSTDPIVPVIDGGDGILGSDGDHNGGDGDVALVDPSETEEMLETETITVDKIETSQHFFSLDNIGLLTSSNVYDQVQKKEGKITLKLPVPVKQ